VKNVHIHEKSKSYPDRYPANSDSIGIEIVGNSNKSNSIYESVNSKQNLSLKWLVNEFTTHLKLQSSDIYPSRLRFRLYYDPIFALTLSPKAPTVGGTPRNSPAITCRFASPGQK